ncbi:MAG: ATP-binding cassette domain-containing protein [Verrucomicrobia bacterium]|nr:ATP-binding cassette domain-containing protein [Verrucomicrobiota bacterium]
MEPTLPDRRAIPNGAAHLAGSAPGQRAQPLIELRSASVCSAEQPNQVVVQGLNWTIEEHQFWVVGGLPGSGKTPLLETAAGLWRPRAGTHLMFGQDVAEMSSGDLDRARRRVGLVFGDGGRLFGELTVLRNVALPLCYHRECGEHAVAAQVAALLADTGLSLLADYYPSQLGRGWRQRTALARALALGPELLFLDNPLAGLDPRQRRWWMEFLTQLAWTGLGTERRRMTVVVAADDLRPWLGMARQFALIQERRWVPLGTRADLERCTEPLLRELLAEAVDSG